MRQHAHEKCHPRKNLNGWPERYYP
ncbi:uncharacterized protein G2W53_018198 [Senna tora]|uniref:Uncharacterized protein n=1 Tax=Senna tora TaxID=362788 RepID=A0A834TSJ9_9FABA|nr:uncharacterized protein G2W53_018198 [Senna tora]